jgi:glycosyltransferase involved in cell wall biosynthesis
MRIGIDAHILGKNKGGVERYVQSLVELLPAAAPQHEIFIFAPKWHRPASVPANARYVTLPIADPIAQRSLLLPWLTRRYQLDLIHVQRVSPPLTRCGVVLTVHDVLPLTRPADHAGLRNFLVRAFTPASLRRADRVLTPSETVRRELIDLFRLPEDKVVAIQNGIDHRLFSAGEPRPKGAAPYALYSGALEPRKNLETVLRAFKEFASARTPRPRLILCGGERAPDHRRQLETLAQDLGIVRDVSFTGFVSDARYLELLRGARLFLAPSRGEGFDLPPLEAMACGIPVICSDVEVHRELFTDQAAFFTTSSAAELASVLGEIWDDPAARKRMRRAGLQRAASFSWENTAWRIAEIYQGLDKSRAA